MKIKIIVNQSTAEIEI